MVLPASQGPGAWRHVALTEASPVCTSAEALARRAEALT